MTGGLPAAAAAAGAAPVTIREKWCITSHAEKLVDNRPLEAEMGSAMKLSSGQ